MIESVKQQMNAEAKAEAEAELAKYEAELAARQKAHDDEVMLEKMRIEAAKEEAAAPQSLLRGQRSVGQIFWLAWFYNNFRNERYGKIRDHTFKPVFYPRRALHG